MEIKINNPYPENDLLVMEPLSGEIFVSEETALLRTQKRVNELAKTKGYFTYNEVLCILTEDWPEDKKKEFFERVNSHEGWMFNEEFCECGLELNECQLNDNGEMLIKLKYEFEPEKEDAD